MVRRTWCAVVLGAIVALVAGVLTPITAQAADNKGVGKDLSIMSREEGWSANPYRVQLNPRGDGSVQLILGGQNFGDCLSTNIHQTADHRFWYDQGTEACDPNQPGQWFHFVPVDKTPTPDSGETFANGEHDFYLVSNYTGLCFFSRYNGLVADDNHPGDIFNRWLVNNRGFADCANPKTQHINGGMDDVARAVTFRVANDWVSDGMSQEWANILLLATKYALNECARNIQSCQVQALDADGKPVTDNSGKEIWTVPGSASVLEAGTISEVMVGCGVYNANGSSGTNTATGANIATSNPFHNLTDDDVQVTLSTTQARTHQVSVSTNVSWGFKIALEIGTGKNDLTNFQFKPEWHIDKSDTTAVLDSETSSVANSLTSRVRPGMWYMTTWTQQQYSLSGNWRFGLELGPGFGWKIPWSVQYPVIVNGQSAFSNAAVTTHNKKDCTASAASTNVTPPAITTVPQSCTDTEKYPNGPVLPKKVITAETTLYACPGSWQTLDTDPSKDYRDYGYQWYLTAGGTDTAHPIAKATNQKFTVHKDTLGDKTLYLGVEVTELGHAKRLESKSAIADNRVQLARASSYAGTGAVVNFVGDVPDALVGQPYSVELVSDADDEGNSSDHDDLDLSLVGSTLPAGFTLSDDGVLSGTPSKSGTYRFTVVDDGGSGEEQSYVLYVYDTGARFVDASTPIEATLGEEFSTSLVAEAGTASIIAVVDGALPDDVELDADGTLHGAPDETGTFTFSVVDTSVGGQPIEFTINVDESADNDTVWADLTDAEAAAADAGLQRSQGDGRQPRQ